VGVAVDVLGNVYIADYATSKVYKETLSGGTYEQSTIGSALNHPTGVAADGSGNVYIAGYNSGQAYKETFSGGTYSQSTLGTGMVDPSGIAVDNRGNVYIADVVMGTVVEEPWTGSGYGAQLTLASGQNGPYSVAVDGNGNVLVANSGSSKILDLTASAGNFGAVNVGSASSSAIVLTFILDTSGTIQSPVALTQGTAGLDFAVTGSSCTAGAYVAPHTCTVNVTFTPKSAGSRTGAAVLKNSSGNVIATGYVYGTGIGPQVNFLPGTQKIVADSSTGLSDPEWVAVDASGNVYIADAVNNRVLKETLSGGSYTQSVISSDLAYPHGVAVDGAGNVYIADTNHGRVVEVPWTGAGYGTEITLPTSAVAGAGLAVDGSGNIYIADLWQNQVLKESPSSGSYTESVVATGLSNPNGLAVDGNGNVYIANYGTNQVLEVQWTGSGYGAQTAVLGNLTYLQGLAVDGSGNLYIADWDGNGTVYKETPSGGGFTQSTITSFPNVFMSRGVAVDGSGNVYLTSDAGAQVLEMDLADAPSINFATTNVGASSNDSPQTVTVGNIGNAPLTFTALNYPTDFTGTSDCSTSTQLTAGTGCSLAISFNPLSAANLNESVQLKDNSLNVASTQNIVVSGIGTTPPPPPQTVPTIVWAPPSKINYGSDLSTVLNAAATDGGGNTISGSFAYTATPAGGSASAVNATTILAAGSYLLIASFTPNDQITYASATASAPLTVNPSFAAVNIGSPSPMAMTVTFVIPSGLPGSGMLASPLVFTQGATGLDFTDATTGSCIAGMNYSSGITCTVNVTFTPKYAGMRYGAVVLKDSLGTILATNYITGAGTGPQVNFQPASQIKLGGGFGNPFGAAVDGSGNLIIADPSNSAVK
jgi:streptogramin lyase